jgi:predicted metallo-beta-lactamase superfamily hydrolase
MVNNGLEIIKVTPLAAESFGVRSMCTLVETPDVTILLDAGISLSPYRFNLPPHPVEFQTISRLRQKIAEAADKASIITISHYHYDHHTPSFEDWVVNWTKDGETAKQIYQNKTVLVKDGKEDINASQRERAWLFSKTGGKHARYLVSADGKTFTYGKTSLRFSPAVAHGSDNTELGWVIMAVIQIEDECFMFAPDVQGPLSNHAKELILAAKPTVLMLGGPPLYLGGVRVEVSKLESGLCNLERIVEAIPITILEHHVLRDEQWRVKLDKVFLKAQAVNHNILTAAEYVGLENYFLESQRKKLYTDQPPTSEFRVWMKTLNNKQITKPPL